MRDFLSVLRISLLTAALQRTGLPLWAADAPAEKDHPMNTVNSVDLTRYTGQWYEISKIPNRFQKQCARGTTAQYSLRDDGRITVVNRCVKENGKLDEAEGIAKIVPDSGNAQLKVSFVSLLGWRPFWGDYWVIGLDEDYRWAVIGTPNRKYGWVLGRTPTLPEEDMAQIYEIIGRNGYDVESFEPSPQ